MKKTPNIRKGALLWLALFLPLGSLLAQGQLIIRVFEDATNAALQGATVEIEALSIREATDNSGRTVLRNVPEGEYTVEVSYRGLPDTTETVQVSSGEPTALPIRMGLDEEVFELTDFLVRDRVTSTDIAQQVERNALNVRDIIASDTMGQMPDQTVADAVRRLPGVSIERAGDNAENQYVAIRGMNSDFNKVLIDGVPLTVGNSDKASRSVPLNVISTSLTDTIEVTKSVTPDMDGDAIGGSINIRTRSAFDYGERYASVEASVGYSENLDEFSSDFDVDNWFPAFDFILSDFFDDAGTLGYTIGGNYRERAYVSSQVKTSGWGYNSGGGAYQPRDVRFEDNVRDIDEYGFLFSLDWRPDETSRLAATYSFSQKETEIYRFRSNFPFDTNFSSVNVADGQTGTLVTDRWALERDVSYFAEQQDVHVFKLDGEKQLGEWKLTGLLGLNATSFEGDPDKDVRARVRTGNDTLANPNNKNFFYDSRGNSFEPVVGSSTINSDTDIGAYDFLQNVNFTTFEIDDTEYLFSGDVERTVELFGEDVDLKFGGRARLRERELNETNRFYNARYGMNPAEIGGLVADYRIDSRVGGEYGRMIVHDPRAIRAFTEAQELAGNPAFIRGATTILEDQVYDAGNSYDAEENIYAAYTMGTVKLDKLTVLAGVRLEFTDVEFNTSDADLNALTFTPVSESNDYLDVLPGLHLRYDATDDFIARASINKTLARPSYRQLQPREFVDFYTESLYDPNGFQVTRGDTKLDPTESWNFDLGFDYYYSSGGYVSLGLFAKYMENNIYSISRPEPVGGRIDEIREVKNANNAEVYGIEFHLEQEFDFFDGIWSNFGASLNVTLVDSTVDTGLTYVDTTLPGNAVNNVRERGDSPLFGQVDTAVNVALFYEGSKFRARLSYNWTDDYLDFNGLSGEGPDLDTYIDAYGQLDFSMGYYITNDIEIFFEADNVTDESSRAYDGSDKRLAFNSYSGRTFFIGASWNL
jgi:TonB-dependent receptor